MSRSWKKPFVVCSHQIDKGTAHRRLRRRVKAELGKPEPDELIVEFDTRDLSLEEWGTRLDMTYDPEWDSDDSMDRKARRK